METIVMKPTVKHQIADIALDVSWAKIAKRYFDKSPSWIYHKIDGIDGNGGDGGFTDAERIQFSNALFDFSERVRHVAQRLCA